MVSDRRWTPTSRRRAAGRGRPDLLTGLTVEVVEEAASTNALVAERARPGAPEGLVVVAEHQTAGRGRLDRTWETPAALGADLLGAAAPDRARGRPGRGCRC